jgi:hypothetical protein
MPVVLSGKYLRRFELGGAGRAVEKLVELLAEAKLYSERSGWSDLISGGLHLLKL